MAGSSTEAPGQHRQPGGSYLLTNGIWCWAWAALTGGFYWLKEHDIMAVFFSMPLWQSGWRCRERRHLVTQRCRALLNRWQETSEESGNGQQMEKRSCRRPEECSAYTQHAASPPVPAHTNTWWVYFLVFSSCMKFWVTFQHCAVLEKKLSERGRIEQFLFVRAQRLMICVHYFMSRSAHLPAL